MHTLTKTVLLAATMALGATAQAKDVLPIITPDSLDKQIRLARDGDTIRLGRGTYDVDLTIHDKSLTIIGVSQKHTIIRNVRRAHSIQGKSDDEMTVTFEHVTFTQRGRPRSSGLDIDSADTVFRHCTFRELNTWNRSRINLIKGAAIRMQDSDTFIDECWFESNTLLTSGTGSRHASGGAIEAFESTLTVEDSGFHDNKVLCTFTELIPRHGTVDIHLYGGAITAYGSQLKIDRTSFEANGVEAYISRNRRSTVNLVADGGAVYIRESEPGVYLKSRITDCTFQSNEVFVNNTLEYGRDQWNASGGAVSIDVDRTRSASFIRNCSFHSNSLNAWNGGAIWARIDADAYLSIRDCDFIRNTRRQVMAGHADERNNFYEEREEE